MDDAAYINIIKHAEEAGAFFNEEDMGYRYLRLITSYEVDRDAKSFEE